MIIMLGSRLQTACDYELLAHEQSVTNSRCVVGCAARIQTAFFLEPRFLEARKERARGDFFSYFTHAERKIVTNERSEREREKGDIYMRRYCKISRIVSVYDKTENGRRIYEKKKIAECSGRTDVRALSLF